MADSNSIPQVRYMDTAAAYDLWSEVYDTDGNFLQALDTIEMKTLLPQLLSTINSVQPWRIVDLGCGTGRNTIALLTTEHVEIAALDLSPKMLEVAQSRFERQMQQLPGKNNLSLAVFDMITATAIPEIAKDADAILSTLVLEHVPLDVFFQTADRMLKPGGLLLVTNMHPEMGNISQAGFVDTKTGEKIRPTSYPHTVEDTVQEAFEKGFELVGEVIERCVDSSLAPQLGVRAAKWIGVKVWFGAIFRKKP